MVLALGRETVLGSSPFVDLDELELREGVARARTTQRWNLWDASASAAESPAHRARSFLNFLRVSEETKIQSSPVDTDLNSNGRPDHSLTKSFDDGRCAIFKESRGGEDGRKHGRGAEAPLR